jgi:Family of unknown function (DUF5631)/Family of unknown function (DUF5632)
VAIFGRNTARQRLRRATRESLKIPAFGSPVDCTPWVTGGLWPAELSTVTAETAPLVKYLKADLQRIVNSANEELTGIRQAGMADPIRQAEEARVINGARAFAVRRVESTVRHLREMGQEIPAEYRPVNRVEETEETRRLPAVAAAQTNQPTDRFAEPSPEEDRHEPAAVDSDDSRADPIDAVQQETPAAEPETVEPPTPTPTYPSDPDDTVVLEEIATVLREMATLTEPPVDNAARHPATARPAERAADESPKQVSTPRHAAPDDEAETAQHPKPLVETESDRERLERLLKFVARQEPGLRWAVGNRGDGTTLLVTDLANGWIPSGITLPAGVRLLEPEWRTGNAKALLGQTTLSVTYAPGDTLGWATDYDVTETSSQPRELPPVDDLGWVLSEATHWRDGLPRMVHTLAKAGAAGTGVVDSELELLRVHLDTARYQLLAQYPDVDAALLLNCLLLAATEGIVSGNRVSANYHFAWFQMLSAPPVSRWKASP